MNFHDLGPRFVDLDEIESWCTFSETNLQGQPIKGIRLWLKSGEQPWFHETTVDIPVLIALLKTELKIK